MSSIRCLAECLQRYAKIGECVGIRWIEPDGTAIEAARIFQQTLRMSNDTKICRRRCMIWLCGKDGDKSFCGSIQVAGNAVGLTKIITIFGSRLIGGNRCLQGVYRTLQLPELEKDDAPHMQSWRMARCIIQNLAIKHVRLIQTACPMALDRRLEARIKSRIGIVVH